jgi:hypothetical protein
LQQKAEDPPFCRSLITDHWSGSFAKKEKRRRRRPANGRYDLFDRTALMFPRDPIEMREASLKDHP